MGEKASPTTELLNSKTDLYIEQVSNLSFVRRDNQLGSNTFFQLNIVFFVSITLKHHLVFLFLNL